MTGYSKVQAHLSLDFSINTQLCIMVPMRRVVATPGTAKSFMEFLGCIVYRVEPRGQGTIVDTCAGCSVTLSLEGLDL